MNRTRSWWSRVALAGAAVTLVACATSSEPTDEGDDSAKKTEQTEEKNVATEVDTSVKPSARRCTRSFPDCAGECPWSWYPSYCSGGWCRCY